jgi:hypothetical protein
MSKSSQLKTKIKNYRIGKYGLKDLKPLAEPLSRVRKEIETRVDDILLDLEHKGFKLQDPQDVIQSIGRKVLERAENVRVQLARQSKRPAWLKDVTVFANQSSESASELVKEFAEKVRLSTKTVTSPRKKSARAVATVGKKTATSKSKSSGKSKSAKSKKSVSTNV